ncbi:PucR family transcriptional regulator [Streptomyces mexicanus]|uniref:PucR family transcriptional regulator n=1 Tax=Streptomyces mexicanus TaxID=178566 RepID=UPI00368CABE1
MPLSAAARALAARCLATANEVARRMARGDFEHLPGYAGLPDDMKDVEIAATVRHGVRTFLRQAADAAREPAGPGPAVEEPEALFRERAAQRAAEGMPLDLLLRSHLRGAAVLWEVLREHTRPGEEAALVELSGALLRAQEHTVAAVTRAYLDEHAALAGGHRARRRALVRDLLAGMVPADPAALAPLGRHGSVSVLVLPAVPPGRGEGAEEGEETHDPVAVRRAAHRLQAALDRTAGSDVLTLFDERGGHALLPGPLRDGDALARRLADACGVAELHCAVAEADGPGGIAAAARTAAEVLRIARACGRPAGLHRLDDVLLEYQLSRPGESSARIRALLDGAADRPDLLGTVRAHLAQGRNRRATAHRLGVHPNTVDNRLARFTALTGLDPTTDRGAALTLAAFLLRDTDGAAPDTPA